MGAISEIQQAIKAVEWDPTVLSAHAKVYQAVIEVMEQEKALLVEYNAPDPVLMDLVRAINEKAVS